MQLPATGIMDFGGGRLSVDIGLCTPAVVEAKPLGVCLMLDFPGTQVSAPMR